jgi:fused signal recognition particle receptor
MVLSGAIRRLANRLSRAREAIAGKVLDLFRGRRIDSDTLDELTEILIAADVGVSTTDELVSRIEEASRERDFDSSAVLDFLREEVTRILSAGDCSLIRAESPPTVILVAGVNGSGKTTTIGKLAYRLKSEGSKVLLAASDTFRPAAIEQLEIWANRVDAGIVKHTMGSDPSAVVYDALDAARARGIDYVIMDTAGRLQTKANLMKELSKIKRVASQKVPEAPHEVLLVLDATVGQNALSQAKLFDEAIELMGIVLAKFDSTSKGGVLLAVRNEVDVPVKLVGVGESIEDLESFDAGRFAEALFGMEESE